MHQIKLKIKRAFVCENLKITVLYKTLETNQYEVKIYKKKTTKIYKINKIKKAHKVNQIILVNKNLKYNQNFTKQNR